ncbi:putative sucrose utilization protein SUC1, partial [Tolypocladium ophioglossoides CBS 100239]
PCPPAPRRIPLAAYAPFLDVFRQRLYPIWPVVAVDQLLADIALDDNDFESYALSAAVCAATIAQLRLPEHTTLPNTVSSLQFALDAQHLRQLFDYREKSTIASLLTPFFLHMYYANANKLQTAGLFLREAITYAHALELDQPDLYASCEPSERSLRLRTYWLLFISERTFCAQNGLPAILHPIDALAPVEDELEGADLQAFTCLTRLFSFLHTDIMSPLRPGTETMEVARVSLCCDVAGDGYASNETQQVDLCVTRQWIRILSWEYMSRHFAMSCQPKDQALSLFLPVQIGHEILSSFTAMSKASIRAHGYGMELKLFKVADAVMDVVTCAPWSARSDGMLLGSGDILSSLLSFLETIGGLRSEFASKLQSRMANLDTTVSLWRYLGLMQPGHDETEANEANEADETRSCPVP